MALIKTIGGSKVEPIALVEDQPDLVWCKCLGGTITLPLDVKDLVGFNPAELPLEQHR
jgi:hypothetical protein